MTSVSTVVKVLCRTNDLRKIDQQHANLLPLVPSGRATGPFDSPRSVVRIIFQFSVGPFASRKYLTVCERADIGIFGKIVELVLSIRKSEIRNKTPGFR